MRVLRSIIWRYRLWTWGDELRVGSKTVRRFAFLDRNSLRAIALGNYEKAERELIAMMQEAGLIRPGDRVIEAGGGLGVIAMHVADIVGDAAVFVFEPDPDTRAGLRENLRRNGHDIHVEDAALVAGDERTVAFSVGHHFYARGTHRRSDHVITVPAESISHAIARLDPTILVLDVEGAEADLVCSVDNFRNVHGIHIEVHSKMLRERMADMFEHLSRHGFRRQLSRSAVEVLTRSG